MALFVLLYAVVAPCKLLPHVRATNQKNLVNLTFNVRIARFFMLFIFLFLAIVIFNVIFTKKRGETMITRQMSELVLETAKQYPVVATQIQGYTY